MGKKRLHIRKGDTVRVITGENKGEEGRVLSVDINKNRAYVEGINMLHKHTRPSNENPQGGILKQEGPVHVSNLMLVDPKSGEPTRVGRQRQEDGSIVRVARSSGETIK